MAQGKRVGYVRVSSVGQNTDRQLDGIELDKTFTEKASGKTADRPELKAMIDYVRDDDIVIVHSMDRLARNVDDLRRIVRELNAKKVTVQFIKEGLTFTGEDSPMATLLLTMLGAVAEFERALIAERRDEGIAIAKANGVYKGRKPALSKVQATDLVARIKAGESVTTIAKHYGISRETVYQYKRAAV
ncbi:MAG: recombinase family protein [Nocardiaceae bacterium]|nr:recombinase family protein [Nocardiaceae bacterium]